MAVGIRITCPQCHTAYRVEGTVPQGTEVTCWVCGTGLIIPGPQDATPTFVQPTLMQPTLAGSSDDRHVTLALASSETPTLQQPADDASSVEELLSVAAPGSGRYVEQGVIAQGGMGEIVLCIDRDIRRPVALKRMLTTTADDPSRRARFVEEAQVTGQLEHPNIVPVHELTRREDGTVYFTMKLVKGKSLADILAAAKQGKDAPSLGELLQVFLKVCDGVAFAHSRGVLHRDLKPANIMVGDFGEVLVMDWGLAKVKGREDIRSSDIVETSRVEKASTRTIEGSMIGTPAYMPPEQAEGKLDQIDERSDIYSLGAVLYEMLALERAIQGETQMAVILNVVKGNIEPPEKRSPGRSVPRELSAIAMKCLSKLRARRYKAVMELRKDIGLFLEGRSVSASPDTFGQAVVKLVKRNKGVSAAMGAAAVVLIALTAAFIVRLGGERNRAVRGEQQAKAERGEAVKARDERRRTALESSEALANEAVRAAEEARFAMADVSAALAVKVMPDGPWGDYARGAVAFEKRDLPTARKHFEQALTLDPKHKPSQASLARVLAKTGELDKSEKLLAGVAQSNDWRQLVAAGDAFFDAKRYSDAEKAYRRAIGFMEGQPAIPASVLGDIKQRAGRSNARATMKGFYASIRHLPLAQQIQPLGEKLTEIYGFRPPIGLNRNGSGFDLDCQGVLPWLDPFEGLPFVQMNIPGSPLSDLSPLRGMALTALHCAGVGVKDLGPLKGMPIEFLNIWGTKVEDLSPLKGAPLKEIILSRTAVADLAPLAGMPLEKLDCKDCRVRDLSPLRGAPLKYLDIHGNAVADLEPLRGAPIKHLIIFGTRVSDLGPLKGMPMEKLECARNGQLRDLSPLRACPLKYLDCAATAVTDLTPLQNLPLEWLNIDGTGVRDLNPIAGLRLVTIGIEARCIKDVVGVYVLRRMRSLKVIGVAGAGEFSVEEFFRKYDAGEFNK